MCLAMAPMLGIMMSGLSAVAGYMQQSQAASAQNAYYLQNAEAANAAARSAYANQQNELLGKREAADQDIFERRVQALKARGTARDAAGEAGVTGLSVDALIDDYYAAEGRGVDSVQTNYEIERDNIIAQMDATHSQTIARVNSVQRAQPPSFLGAAIRIAGGFLSPFGSSRMGYGGFGGYGQTAFSPTTNYSLGIG